MTPTCNHCSAATATTEFSIRLRGEADDHIGIVRLCEDCEELARDDGHILHATGND